jgi:hypothetical protein
MYYTQMSEMHFSKDFYAFQNTVLNTYGHWIIIHIWSEIKVLVLEFV